MRSLDSLDAFFLASEDARTTVNVSSLVILEKARKDKTPVTRADIVELIRSRLHLLPPLRWHLAEVPLGIAHPQWVDGDVDLDYHVASWAYRPPATFVNSSSRSPGLWLTPWTDPVRCGRSTCSTGCPATGLPC